MKIKNLKTWDYVKTRVYDLTNIFAVKPELYLYQLSGGMYYPAIKISDVPEEFLK